VALKPQSHLISETDDRDVLPCCVCLLRFGVLRGAGDADSSFLQQSGHSFLQECPKPSTKRNVEDATHKGTAEEHESGSLHSAGKHSVFATKPSFYLQSTFSVLH